MANIILHPTISSHLVFTLGLSEKRILNAIYAERGQLKKSDKKSSEKSRLTYKPENRTSGDKFSWIDNDKTVYEGGSKGSSVGLKFWYWCELKEHELNFCPDAVVVTPQSFNAWLEKFKMTAEEKAEYGEMMK